MPDRPDIVHEFDWPDRVVVGTVGRPGERTFYLQARTGARSIGVVLEKEQSAMLAERIDQLLDALSADPASGVSVPARAPVELIDDDPLDQPVEEQFRVGTMRLSWDPRTAQVVLEAYPLPLPQDEDEDDDGPEPDDDGPDEMLLLRIPVGTARAFAQRTRQVVHAGRPPCPLCGQPVDPDGHVCALPDGV
ncbi:hypothetical protein N866_03995 [Actinotalea ferrariae CF5-4]|uniref:Repeat protein (TIGR03847 family) n=1 Tax=Actinotalea ferrariae CF5-4 TaxID=948458 RepID=A0A021VP55_9CELL|nr:DUF3090 domain-containing protein [Actinotalea ferrariae]EYR62974.1 hypothetical protein N866_03995 [Actinotalea ferrariae CF5-4]